MKKYLLIFLAIFICSLNGAAESRVEKTKNQSLKKELKEFKFNYLADEMGLSDEQRKQFKEVFNQMEEEKREIIHKCREIKETMSENKNASEAEYENASKELGKCKAKLADIESRYNARLSKFLTQKQIFLMQTAEENFNKKMRNCVKKKTETKNKKTASLSETCHDETLL